MANRDKEILGEKYTMSKVSKLAAPAVSGFDTKEMTWNHLEGGDDFDYHIDYWIAILGCRPDEGRIEFLGKWEPNAYCHYHRHLGETTTIVLEGEHHLIEEAETQKIHKTRTRGHYSKSPYGEAHMERAGESGSVLFFSMQCPDKYVFDILDRDDNVLNKVTIEDFAAGNY